MHLFFSTPIWATKIANYKEVNEDLLNYISNLSEQDQKGIIIMLPSNLYLLNTFEQSIII